MSSPGHEAVRQAGASLEIAELKEVTHLYEAGLG